MHVRSRMIGVTVTSPSSRLYLLGVIFSQGICFVLGEGVCRFDIMALSISYLGNYGILVRRGHARLLFSTASPEP